MARQSRATRNNIHKAGTAAKRKQTLKHLSGKTRHALGVQANKVKRHKQGGTHV